MFSSPFNYEPLVKMLRQFKIEDSDNPVPAPAERFYSLCRNAFDTNCNDDKINKFSLTSQRAALSLHWIVLVVPFYLHVLEAVCLQPTH